MLQSFLTSNNLFRFLIKATRQKPLLIMTIYGYIQHRTSLIHESLDPLSKGFTLGTQLGIIEYAGYNGSLLCSYAYFSGERLENVEIKMNSFLMWMDEYKFSGNTRKSNAIFTQTVHCLQGRTKSPYILDGTYVALSDLLIQAEGNNLLKCTLDLCRLELFYLFHRYKDAGSILEGSLDVIKLRPGHFSGVRFTFYECLVSIQLANTTGNKVWISRANAARSKIFKWVKSGNVNCLHMVSLIEAETAVMEGKIDDAATFFNQITIDSKNVLFLNDKALLFERSGLFFKGIGNDIMAKESFSKAHQLYSDWGAKAKKDHLLQLNCNQSKK